MYQNRTLALGDVADGGMSFHFDSAAFTGAGGVDTTTIALVYFQLLFRLPCGQPFGGWHPGTLQLRVGGSGSGPVGMSPTFHMGAWRSNRHFGEILLRAGW